MGSKKRKKGPKNKTRSLDKIQIKDKRKKSKNYANNNN